MVTKQKKSIVLLIQKIISGVVIGIGAIVPGVSGSVMAISLGIYRDMIDSVANIFKYPRTSIIYLLPIGIGLAAGFFGMSNIVEWLMVYWRTPILFLFIGLVLGGAPTIIKEGNKPHGFKPKYLIATVAGFALIFVVTVICKITPTDHIAGSTLLPYQSLISGAILALGVIPGFGGAFILIHLGFYEPLMAALNRLDIGVLALVGLGCAGVALLMIKGVQKLFALYTGFAYYLVLGLSIASAVLIFPPVQMDISLLWNILLLIVGFGTTSAMAGINSKETMGMR